MVSVSIGPVALLAEAGAHVLVLDAGTAGGGSTAGAIALFGAGAAF